MSRHHADKHGTYDLAAVMAITPAIEKNKDGEVKSKKAVLHYPGGTQLATNTDYDKLVTQWKGGTDAGKPAADPVASADDDDDE